MSPYIQESPAQTMPPVLGAAFPIVGIGASAGGLEAMELFLEKMPKTPGMAFVIVQHLAPNHKQMLREILAPLTCMPVKEITDGMPVKKNTIYIIPPNKDLSIHKRILYLLDPVDPKGLRLPINTFFKSLALDLEEKSIGVILSGMGRDGTDGLKAIKEKAGICFVQNPASAKFDNMPQNAIESGLADVVADPGDLATSIISYSKNLPLHTLSNETCNDEQARDLQKIILLLLRHSGQDFSEYKINTLIRRIERRMGLHQVKSMKRYIHYLQETPQELDLLLSELLIGVTRFFRDPPMWEALSHQLFPEWFQLDPENRSFRIWVPACSTGEEAYSMAILYKEALEKHHPQVKFSLQIFATDLNQIAIDNAREGVFSTETVSEIPKDLVKKYFTLTPHDTYRINKSIRECVIFARQNVLMDPPFTKIDLLICRNLLIYLTPKAQEKLLPLFHFSLNPKGYLFLGSAETTGSKSYLFDPVHKKSRIFQKVASDRKSDQLDFPTFMRSIQPFQPPSAIMSKEESLQALTEKMILSLVSPPV